MKDIVAIAFDADDTLWHTEHLFQSVQARVSEILHKYASHDDVQNHFHATEMRNFKLFGYGVKGFTLSMIETAIEISQQKISAEEIHEIVTMGKGILAAPMNVFDGIEQVLGALQQDYRLFLITKGDVLDQRSKIERSNLMPFFERTDIVQEKDSATYASLFREYGIGPEQMAMVGNSLPSDILPVLDLGGVAIHIPYHVTAHFENGDRPVSNPRLHYMSAAAELPDLFRRDSSD